MQNFSGDTDYASSSANAQLIVLQRNLIVTADSGQNKLFGTIDPVFTYAYSPNDLPVTVPFSGVLSREPGEAIGVYDITQGTLSAGDNFTITFISDKFTITGYNVFLPIIFK